MPHALRRILAQEGLLSVRKASDSILGYLGVKDELTNDYGDDLTLTLDGSTVNYTVRSWGRIGGIDSFHGAGPREVSQRLKSPADGVSVVNTIRSILKNRKHIYLSSELAKPSEFLWKTPYFQTSLKLKGLSSGKAQAAIDSWNMDRTLWEAKYLKPVVKPTGGPFLIDPSTPFKDVLEQVQAQGFGIKMARDLSRYELVAMIVDARRIKQLLLMFEASSDSKKRGTDDSGWEFFQFNFGGRTIEVGKAYIDYSSRWVLRDRK